MKKILSPVVQVRGTYEREHQLQLLPLNAGLPSALAGGNGLIHLLVGPGGHRERAARR